MFMYAWRDREAVLDILAAVGGNRVNYGINTIGGVRRDIDDSLRQDIVKMLDALADQVKYYQELALTETTLAARLAGIGKLSGEDALKYGAVGPVIRAAGIDFDIRAVDPYAAYGEIPFKVITDTMPMSSAGL